MFFSISFYIALAIFGIGILYKVSTWFRYNTGIATGEVTTAARVAKAVKGIVATLFSGKIIVLLRIFILDGLFQIKVLKQDFLRWRMHICIYGGFMLLLLMHALENQITAVIFPDYYSTVNPFMFLRNVFGLIVILGIVMAVVRRFIMKVPRLKTNAMDHYAIIILAVIMLSGFALEGVKITSHTRFTEMVEDYGSPDEEEEVKALESYWVAYYGVVSPNEKGPFDEEILAAGKDAHEMSCMECHSRPQWAFLSYGASRILSPAALMLDRLNALDWLWYIHFLACWIGLAYLPFSKMFHMFTSPLSLMANAVMDSETSDPANIATRQVMELDACTHCCTCSLNCSIAVAYEYFPNINIFPSEKIAAIKALAAGKDLSEQQLRHIQEGIYLCTNCKRCTVVCPVGINLQDLWFSVREKLLQKGYPEYSVLSPLSFYRGLMHDDGLKDGYREPLNKARETIAASCDLMVEKDRVLPLISADSEFKDRLKLSDQANTFSVCFGCETCTSACPVVANYENPQEVLGLLPHQIMHTCAVGIKDLAFGSNMLWDCLTCYQCQEQCPQNVCVTDVLYELKNEAIKRVREKTQV
jgi:heterodisulfide reductase subunit C/nitrate reductase gamma subunit